MEEKREDRALDVLREFLGLDAIGREIVFRFLIQPESSLQEVANYLADTFRRPFTLQAVHWRIGVMRKGNPTFGRLLSRTDLRIGPVGSRESRGIPTPPPAPQNAGTGQRRLKSDSLKTRLHT